jgi:hypothetical protein
MKGATAEPWLNTKRNPNKPRTIKTGRSQNFFRTLMNFHNSIINDIFKSPLIKIDLSCFVVYRYAQSNSLKLKY